MPTCQKATSGPLIFARRWCVFCVVAGLFPAASPGQLVADHRGGQDGNCKGSSFTSASGHFTSADIGKIIVISGDAQGPTGANPKPVTGADEIGHPVYGQYHNSPLFAIVTAVATPASVTLGSACASAMETVATAQWDLGTDNSAALQRCLRVNLTCSVAAGEYLVSGPAAPTNGFPYQSNVFLRSNNKLVCQPGAQFYFPHHDLTENTTGTAVQAASFLVISNISHAVISGCTIIGSDNRGDFTAGIEFNWPIVIVGSTVSASGSLILGVHNVVRNNTIQNGWSDGEILLTNFAGVQFFSGAAPTGTATTNTVAGNTLKNCGFNGIAVVSGINNVISNNTLTDCNLDIEPNPTTNAPGQTSDPVRGNTLRGNSITAQTARNPQPVSFDTCAVGPCAMDGADSIVMLRNRFRGPVQINPYCNGPKLGQRWSGNIATLVNGSGCQWGQAGCAAVAAGTPCSLPANPM